MPPGLPGQAIVAEDQRYDPLRSLRSGRIARAAEIVGFAYRRAPRINLFLGTGLAGDEDVFLGESLDERGGLAKIGLQHVDRIAGDPLRQVDRRVDPGVESNQDSTAAVADVLNRVSKSLRNVAGVALIQG